MEDEKVYIQIELDKELKRKMKIESARSGRTFKQIVTKLLINYLKEKEL